MGIAVHPKDPAFRPARAVVRPKGILIGVISVLNDQRPDLIAPKKLCPMIPFLKTIRLSFVLTALSLAAAAPLISAPTSYVDGNPVLFWNKQALDATRLARNPPPVIALWFASYHAAIADAVNGIAGEWQPWLVKERAPDGADMDAAIASAAYTVLKKIWGQQVNPRTFEQAYKKSLDAIEDGKSKEDGIAWGAKVANAVLEDREDSGFRRPSGSGYNPSFDPGKWRPTAPEFRSAVTPQMANTRPFVMTSPDQFRAPEPPPVGSKEYAEQLAVVAEHGARDDPNRSEYDTMSVVFWADALGSSGPSGHWNMIATQIAVEKGLGTVECARLFALLNFAASDGFISAWDNKYYYNVARPETDLRELTKDNNPHVEQKPDFIPSMASLPFPSYTSAHMTFSTAAGSLLANYFGSDEIAFSIGSDGLPGVVRSYDSFSEAFTEVGQSRIFGGIHTPMDIDVALVCGKQIGDWVFENSLQPTRN